MKHGNQDFIGDALHGEHDYHRGPVQYVGEAVNKTGAKLLAFGIAAAGLGLAAAIVVYKNAQKPTDPAP